jgi:hypothetical protein
MGLWRLARIRDHVRYDLESTWHWIRTPDTEPSLIRSQSGWLAGALGLLCACAIGLSYYLGSWQTQNDRLSREIQDVQTRLHNSDAENQLRTQLWPNLLDLYRRGWVGHERRMEWVERLDRLGRQWSGAHINYEIEAQKTASPDALAGRLSLQNSSVYSSPMKLSMDLLHEGDVFRILGGLQAEPSLGLMEPQACQLHKEATNIKADCQVTWNHLQVPDDWIEVLEAALAQSSSPQLAPGTNSSSDTWQNTSDPWATLEASQPLGRLLTQAAERQRLDDLRLKNPALGASQVETESSQPQSVTWNGVVHRPGKPSTIWIDEVPYLAPGLPAGMVWVPHTQPQISRHVASHKGSRTRFTGHVPTRPAPAGGYLHIEASPDEHVQIQAGQTVLLEPFTSALNHGSEPAHTQLSSSPAATPAMSTPSVPSARGAIPSRPSSRPAAAHVHAVHASRGNRF